MADTIEDGDVGTLEMGEIMDEISAITNGEAIRNLEIPDHSDNGEEDTSEANVITVKQDLSGASATTIQDTLTGACAITIMDLSETAVPEDLSGTSAAMRDRSETSSVAMHDQSDTSSGEMQDLPESSAVTIYDRSETSSGEIQDLPEFRAVTIYDRSETSSGEMQDLPESSAVTIYDRSETCYGEIQDLPETSEVTIHDQSETSTTSLEDLPGTSDMRILNLPRTSVYVEATSYDTPEVGTSSSGIDVVIRNPGTLNNGHHLDGRMDVSSVEKFIEIIESYAIRNEQEINELQTLLDHIFSDDPALASTAEMKIKTYISRMEITECEVCVLRNVYRKRSCCGLSICEDCLRQYLSTQVLQGSVMITCPGVRCQHRLIAQDIRHSLSSELAAKYDQFMVEVNREPNRKTCPKCSEITTVDLTAVTDKASKDGLRIQCVSCNLDWCFKCQAPWHDGITCKQFQTGDILLKSWTKSYQNGQVNARRCPKCKVIRRVLAWFGLMCFFLPWSGLTRPTERGPPTLKN